jgi:hypothetical protein
MGLIQVAGYAFRVTDLMTLSPLNPQLVTRNGFHTFQYSMSGASLTTTKNSISCGVSETFKHSISFGLF